MTLEWTQITLTNSMRYSFKDYTFDSNSLILTKAGIAIDIRHNEAKVLALLIAQKDKVISKDDILAEVWENKVVSDQAVFQNISHLRAMFGNDAIKTFSKRGYQWQLNVSALDECDDNIRPENTNTRVQSVDNDLESPKAPNKNNRYFLIAIASSLLVALAVLLYDNNQEHQIRVAYIPFSITTDVTPLSLDSSENLALTKLTDYDTFQYRASSVLEYKKLKETYPLILTGEIRQHQDKFYLDFQLQGPTGEWSGMFSGDSQNNIEAQLWQHLAHPFVQQLIEQQQPLGMQQAILSIAHQSDPNDLNVLNALTMVYIRLGHLDHAMVMAEKMQRTAAEQGNLSQLGHAYVRQSQILTNSDLFKLSSEKLALAIENFEQANDLKGQADAWHANSWLEHKFDSYEGVKNSLLTAAELALEAKDIARELEALTYLAVMAHKHKENTDKYSYLQQAENKMRGYELPTYHFAKVPFHYAIYADNPLDKEPHYKRVLEVTALTPDHWVAQASREALVEFYISQNRLDEAALLVHDNLTDNAENSYLQTLIAAARGQHDLFEQHAQKAFEQAKLSGKQTLSLDIALLLCGQDNEQRNYDYYSQYISDNATAGWRKRNESRLVALNL